LPNGDSLCAVYYRSFDCHHSAKNIILTPVKSSKQSTSQNQPSISLANNITPHQHPAQHNNQSGVDFTNAHLVIERNNQGKHQIGQVILKSTSTQLIDTHNESCKQKSNLNETTTSCTNCDEMTGMIKNQNTNQQAQQSAIKQNQLPITNMKYAPLVHNYNNINISNSIQSSSSAQNSIFTFHNNNNNNQTKEAKTNLNSPLIKTESVLKNKMKK
jgi:hypothetical protein